MRRPVTILSALVGAIGSACAADTPLDIACIDIGWIPVVVEVRDQFDRPSAIGAMARIERSDGYAAETRGYGDSLRIGVGDPVTGVFRVQVSRPFHTGATVHGVEVRGDPRCGIPDQPTRVSVMLPLAPDAPPLRQVVLPPHSYGFGGANFSSRIHAFVVADSGVSTDVSWLSRDTTVARVSNDGVVTSACRAALGSTFVIASAVVDPLVSDSVRVTVWPSPGC